MKPHPRGLIEMRPGVWYVRYADATGKMRWKKAGTKTAALMLYQKLKAQVARQRLFPETTSLKSVLFRELMADCLRWSKIHKRSWREDVWRAKRLYERFGKMSADAVGMREIEVLKSEMLESGLSNSAVNRSLAFLSLVFRLAVAAGKARDNPVKRVTKLRENAARTRFLSAEEEKKLRSAISQRFPEHIEELDIALHTGMRQGEQYGLTWKDVNLENGCITIRLSKSGAPRYVPINSVALQAFSRLREASPSAESVFAIKSPRAWFSAAVRGACLTGFRWHDIRHTFASRLVMAGVPIRSVQELMGHKTITMTMRYAHLAQGFQREAVEKLTVVKTVDEI